MNAKLFFMFPLSLGLAACSADFDKEPLEPHQKDIRRNEGMGKFLGENTLTFGGKKQKNQEEGSGIGVNSFLWRGTLDTIAFMPLISADPFGGVIITDWYSPPQTPNERLKISVFILDRQLRSDGLKVSMFRQERDKQGGWVDKPVLPETIVDIENAIFARARHFRSITVK